MIRKVVCGFFAAALLMGAGVQTRAANRFGSIQVSLDVGELPVNNGSLTLHHVGLPVQEGYRIADDFGGGLVKAEDAESVYLAQWLAESADGAGKKVNLDVDGNVAFSNLEEGLYLVIQTERTDGFYPIKPTLITLPDENQWDVRIQKAPDPIILDNPQTGQQPWPVLAAMGLVGSGVGIYLCADSKRKK